MLREGKQGKMNPCVYAKLKMSLRVEICVAATLFAIFAELFVQTYEEKKERYFENCLYLFGLALKDQYNSIVKSKGRIREEFY